MPNPTPQDIQRPMQDIQDTYLFPYYSFEYSGTNPVEKALCMENAAGVGIGTLVAQRSFSGDNIVNNETRQFEFWFSEYTFKGHQLHAFVVGEMYPQLFPNSNLVSGTLIKVRLGGYDLNDPFTRDLAGLLSDMSRGAVRRYPQNKTRDLLMRLFD